jgi:hypothetical protein
VDVTAQRDSRDDGMPPDCARIEVRVGEVRQLFNSMDPAPFRERDLDPKAEAFIVDSARELRRHAPLGLVVRLSRAVGAPEDVAALPQAVREYFAERAAATRTQLRRLLRTGGWSLLIGLAFVAAANLIGDWVGELAGRYTKYEYGRLLHESVVIGAWVALWRPLEILLYDWWPILGEARLFDRLGAMHVEVVRD